MKLGLCFNVPWIQQWLGLMTCTRGFFLACITNHHNTYTYMHTHVHTFIHTSIPTSIHHPIHAYIHTVPTYTKHRTYMHGWMHAFMHTHTHTSYIHACIHACMHSCMHAWMDECWMHAWVHTYNIDIISHGDSANTFTKRRSYLKNEIVISMVKQFQGSIWVGPKLGYQQPMAWFRSRFFPKTDGHKLDIIGWSDYSIDFGQFLEWNHKSYI